MTNEELAIAIQAGENRYDELWEQVKKFIYAQSRKFFVLNQGTCSRAGIEQDDLIQCGFLALCDAVQAYKADGEYKLITYLSYPLKNRFHDAVGIRSRKTITLNHCASLDKPITEDADSLTIGDMVPDAAAKDTLDNVIEREYQSELHNALSFCIAMLEDSQQNIIQCRYYNGLSLEQAGERLGVPKENARQLEAKALRSLRHPRYSKLLRRFRDEIIDRYAWRGTGFAVWYHTGASSVERTVEKLDTPETGQYFK